MWIRSQDRVELMEVFKVSYKCNPSVGFLELKGHHLVSRGEVMGKYKSEKRCFKVLDEIQKEINKCISTSNYLTVYQMPKE